MNSIMKTEAYTPEYALDMIRVTAPDTPIRVRGKVTQLNPYPRSNPHTYYGRLESLSGGGSITFKCPAESAPKATYQMAVIEGTLTIKPHKLSGQNGLEVILSGYCLGEFDIPETAKKPLFPEDRVAKIGIKKFLTEIGNIESIGIIGTQTALNDVRNTSTLNPHHFAFCEIVSMTDREKIIGSIRSRMPKAVILTRGGDDDSISLWDKPEFIAELLNLNIPFYTALGHAHRLTLADHYADQSFLTPTDLGHLIKQTLSELDQAAKLQNDLSATLQANDSIRQNLYKERNNSEDQQKQLKELLAHQKKINRFLIVALAITSIFSLGFLVF